MNNILVTITDAPSFRVSEVLRMSVGLTLEDGNRVHLLLIDKGALAVLGYSGGLLAGETEKPLRTLEDLSVEIFVHETSLDALNLANELKFGVTRLDDAGVEKLIDKMDVVIS